MAIPIHNEKNIWVAAADGDLERVRTLIEQQLMSPNAPDPSTYTPMHAAASYAQLDVLDYLVSRGGDVNITDLDGDTPLFTVEDIPTARFLIEHGAIVDVRNNEGLSPIEHLQEDFPHVAEYLRSAFAPQHRESPQLQYHQNTISENLTSSLMMSVEAIMQRAEAEHRDPEEELRQVVTRTVLEGVSAGYRLTTTEDEQSQPEHHGLNGVKRPRRDSDGLGE